MYKLHKILKIYIYIYMPTYILVYTIKVCAKISKECQKNMITIELKKKLSELKK